MATYIDNGSPTHSVWDLIFEHPFLGHYHARGARPANKLVGTDKYRIFVAILKKTV